MDVSVSSFRERPRRTQEGERLAAKPAASTGRGRGRAAAPQSTGEAISGAIGQRLKQLEKTQQNLEKRFKGFVDSLQKLFLLIDPFTSCLKNPGVTRRGFCFL